MLCASSRGPPSGPWTSPEPCGGAAGTSQAVVSTRTTACGPTSSALGAWGTGDSTDWGRECHGELLCRTENSGSLALSGLRGHCPGAVFSWDAALGHGQQCPSNGGNASGPSLAW